MELGYFGIAYNRSMKGVMSEKDRCAIPLLTIESLVKLAPPLASSVGFHRHLLGVRRETPFRQYTRITVSVESNAQSLALNSDNPVLKSYDVVGVRPLNQSAFDQACEKAKVDMISIDFSGNLAFRLKHPMVKAAVQRGIYFEIRYSDLLVDAHKRRQVISNAKLLVDWTRGKNLIISSGAPCVTELRGPIDVTNLMSSLLGISTERARAAISKNCRNMISNALRRKRFYKDTVRVELASPEENFNLRWDPLSSGDDGDMALDDLSKAFAETTKSSKAIDFACILDDLPSHGFRFNDKVNDDEPVVQSDQASELPLAAPDGNLLENGPMSHTSDQKKV
ncbi:PREDICTED: ribonuclease P protein subunit p30-like [Tarenaya hassleriana]|uniref:ribonuclease P protein subunit p30-like n=1 Tax=Tarenaya hassleriana TaxID=28532 RepID=UPI00053C0B69|nr:PREDICTED: ribonuclease P protein subunit p30-like [Tarenaya hassleriana]